MRGRIGSDPWIGPVCFYARVEEASVWALGSFQEHSTQARYQKVHASIAGKVNTRALGFGWADMDTIGMGGNGTEQTVNSNDADTSMERSERWLVHGRCLRGQGAHETCRTYNNSIHGTHISPEMK